jgi:hypothetical protein
MLYGISKNSAELYGIPCRGILFSSAEFPGISQNFVAVTLKFSKRKKNITEI